MKKLLIQPFKLATYHNKRYIIKNPRFHRYELLNEYQLELLEALRNGASVSSLLFPKVGIATMYHFQNCISLIRTLQNLHLLKVNYDESVLKDDPTRTTQVTMDISTLSHALAEKIIQIGGRVVSYLPAPILLILCPISVIVTMFFFPGLVANMSGTLGVFSSALVLYLGVTLSLLVRQFIRAGYLYKYMRSPFSIRFCFLTIFPTISLNTSDIWMEGYNSRVRLAIVSLLSPFIVSFFAVLLSVMQVLPFDIAVLSIGTSAIAFLLNLFPIFPEDGSELIHLFTVGRKGAKLKNETASKIREIITRASTSVISLSSSTIYYFLAAVTWMLLWVGFLQKSKGIVLERFTVSSPGTSTFLSSLTTIGTLAAVLYLLYLYFQVFFSKKEKEKIQKLFVKGEIIKQLSKVPLFSKVSSVDKSYITEHVNKHFYKRNTVIFKQGDTGSDLFIILSGKVRVFFRSDDGKERDIGYLKAGDTFGEISSLEGVPRTVNAVSMENCVVVSVPKGILDDYVLDKILNKNEVKRIVRLTSFLQNHPIFSCMSAKEKVHIISRLSFMTVSENENLAEGGSDGILENCFVVHSGYLKVSNDKESFNLSTNDFFYPNLNGNSPNDVSVEIKKSGGILSMKKEDFRDLIWDRFSDGTFLQNI